MSDIATILLAPFALLSVGACILSAVNGCGIRRRRQEIQAIEQRLAALEEGAAYRPPPLPSAPPFEMLVYQDPI